MKLLVIGVLAVLSMALQQPAPAPPEIGQNQQPQPNPQSGVSGVNQTGPQTGGANVTVQPTADLAKNQPQGEPKECCGASSANGRAITIATTLAAICTGIIAVFTWKLWAIGETQAKTLESTLATNKIVERAYVSMTHTPNGLRLVDNPIGNPHSLHVDVRFVNGGHTPADIIGFEIWFAVAAPVNNPNRPPIPLGDPTAFIMPSDGFDIPCIFPITLEQRNCIAGDAPPRLPVLVIGWVVYRDRFGHRHRTGYGRMTIDPVHVGSNDLFFITEPGYNYQEELD